MGIKSIRIPRKVVFFLIYVIFIYNKSFIYRQELFDIFPNSL